MKKILTAAIVFLAVQFAFAWGSKGHRVVGEVASENIKNRTARKLSAILNHQGVASVANFGDDIKSDDRYRKFYTWHFVNFNFGEKYNVATAAKEGDLISGIETCINLIKDKNTSNDDKTFYLKLLVHFVGDLHQPLHVGRGSDKGGNDIKVKWFGENSNLHRVWDEDMINHFGMSYTELANDLPYKTKEEIEAIKKGSLLDWVYESQQIAQTIVYPSVKPDENLSYRYQYNNFGTVKQQLQKAGFRLAKILDDLMKNY